MAISSRSVWALGLGILGVGGLVGVSHGQQGDGDVKKAAANPSVTAPAPRPAATVVGSIDLEAVFRGYEKTKFHMEQLKAEALAKQGELKGYATEAQQVFEEMKNFQQGTADFKARDAKMTKLKANMTAVKETAEREGQAKYAEIMATFYKEVQEKTAQVAKSKGITYVVRVSNEAIDSQDPEGVMAAMARPVVYADPATDLTRWVVYNLNLTYQQNGGQIVKTPPAGAAETGAESPATAPAARPPVPKAAARPAAGTPR